MSETTVLCCDTCKTLAPKPTIGSPVGWLAVYGGTPHMKLDLCSNTCLRAYVLREVPEAPAMVVRQ